MLRTLTFVVCCVASLSLLLVCAPALAGESMTEPATGTEFALERASAVSEAKLALTGVGLRKKMVFKVYAFGFYVDGPAIAPALTEWKGKDADALRADPSFYSAVISAPVERLAVMKFARKVGADSMREALDGALGRGVSKDDPARAEFLGFWDTVIKKREEVLIAFGPAGEVTVLRDGKVRGQVTSEALSAALLESWLGAEPVSENIKEGVVERFPGLI